MKTVQEKKLRTISSSPQPMPDQQQNNQEEAGTADQSDSQSRSRSAKRVPETIKECLAMDDGKKIDLIFSQLVAGLHNENEKLNRKAAYYLASTLECLVESGEWQRLDRLLPAIQQAVIIAGKDDDTAGQCINSLIQLASHHIGNDRYDTAREALMIIISPANRHLLTEDFQAQAQQMINDMATVPLMEKLLATYLKGKKKQEEAGRLLTTFGKKAAEFLMDPLSLDENLEDRIAILRLIDNIGLPAEDTLRRVLQRSKPWYVTRNIIKLLGRLGNPECFPEIAHFLDHEDIRVKTEVLRAVGMIDTSAKKIFLLDALETVPRQLTEQVVFLLGDIPDSSLVVPLAELLEETAKFRSTASDSLQITICQAVGKIGSIKALPTLKKIIANNSPPGASEKELQQKPILKAAIAAVKLIERGGIQKIQNTRMSKNRGIIVTSDPVVAKESAIFRLAMSGDKKNATRKLFELIIECVVEKDFLNAERLRDRFNEIDPRALREIIQSAEIIDQAKNGVIVRGYLDVWSSLLDELTAEEFSAIYHELEHRTLEPEEMLVSQGDKNDELFFINHGSVKIYYKQDYHKIFIKSLTGGNLAGESFFDASIWTISLSALTPSRISILKRSSFIRWQEAFPGLEQKLKDFYNRSNDVYDLLNSKGLNRRVYERYNVSRQVSIQMTDGAGKAIGREFIAKPTNISRGGLALQFRISSQNHGRVLLGRTMQITIPIGGKSSDLIVLGQVLGVHPVSDKSPDYKVHLVFTEVLTQETLQSVLG